MQKENKYLKHFFIGAFLLCGFFVFSEKVDAAVYLDGSTTGCNNGSTNYNPSTRSCGGGADTVYTSLSSFNTGIIAGSTNYIRTGSYYRTSGSWVGALDISGKAGTENNPTIVRAYPGEERQVIIGTAADKLQYNPDPADSSGTLSWSYYPNPAITVRSSFVTVSGLKTYGQVRIVECNDSIIENCDIGGGGPADDQGNPVTWNTAYNLVLRNSYIHHGVDTIDSDNNGSLLIMYHASGLIEYNTFEDGWGNCVHNKDGQGQSGRNTEIRYNFFKPSAYFSGIQGVRGFNQLWETSNVFVHHNIFYNLETGYDVVYAPSASNIVYNNTFINNDFDLMYLTPDQAIPLQSYNNLFYHSASGGTFLQVYNSSYLTSDFNLHYGPANWIYYYSPVASSLSEWKTYSSKDADSISTNPNFINASGITTESFKRTSYSENFTTSPYGTYAGAYETGDEQIGHDWAVELDIAPPNNPSGLAVI